MAGSFCAGPHGVDGWPSVACRRVALGVLHIAVSAVPADRRLDLVWRPRGALGVRVSHDFERARDNFRLCALARGMRVQRTRLRFVDRSNTISYSLRNAARRLYDRSSLGRYRGTGIGAIVPRGRRGARDLGVPTHVAALVA